MIRAAAILIGGSLALNLGGCIVRDRARIDTRRPVAIIDSRPYICAERLGITYTPEDGVTEQLVAFQWCMEGRL